MKLSLSIWQRVTLMVIVSETRGNVRRIRQASSALDVLEFSDTERAEIGYREKSQGIVWDPSSDRTYQIEFADKNVAKLVVSLVTGYQGWSVGQLEQIDNLFEQLGIEPD